MVFSRNVLFFPSGKHNRKRKICGNREIPADFLTSGYSSSGEVGVCFSSSWERKKGKRFFGHLLVPSSLDNCADSAYIKIVIPAACTRKVL